MNQENFVLFSSSTFSKWKFVLFSGYFNVWKFFHQEFRYIKNSHRGRLLYVWNWLWLKSRWHLLWHDSVQFSSVDQSCPTLCDPMNCSTPGLPVHHQLPEFTQTHIHRVGDAIQPSHPLLSPFPPALNPSQHQGLFQWVNSLHEVAKVLEIFSFNIIPSKEHPELISFRIEKSDDIIFHRGTNNHFNCYL